MKALFYSVILTLAAIFGTRTLAADAPKVLFEDKFSDHLDAGWQWIREQPDHWRIVNGALVIDTLPGSYWEKQNNSQNTLVRPAPVSLKDGFIVEVLLESDPKEQYEHAGLICYFDGLNTICYNKESIDGKPLVLMAAEQDGKPIFHGPYQEGPAGEVWLRLIIRGSKVTGQFRSSENVPWQTVGERTLPTSTKELLVGLHSGYGLEKPQRQARFRDFRILAASANEP
jgi:regulation of enolase protein 1 (concanavalin A-like superfamily)